MKKTNLLFYILTLMLALPLFISCSDEDETFVVKKRLVKQDFSAIGEEIYYFEYDNKNRLISYSEHKIIDKVNDSTYSEAWLYKFEYGADGKLVKQITKSKWDVPGEMDYTDYIYSNDTVFAVRNFVLQTSRSVIKDTLILNNKGFLIKQLSSNWKYFYTYDANNNLTNFKLFRENGTLLENIDYEYDNLINAFSNQNVPAWFWAYYSDGRESAVGANNQIVPDNAQNLDDQLPFSYIADQDGYPISMKYGSNILKNMNTYELVP